MDEHRTLLKPVLGKVWAQRGRTPIVTVKPRYEWLYIYAFACPATGESLYWLCDSVNISTFGAVLRQFAHDTQAGHRREIVLVLDRAGWHTSAQVNPAPGVHPVFLPPYSPELQPAERLWTLTDAGVKNRCPASLSALSTAIGAQCARLERQWSTVRPHIAFHWWPGVPN